MATSEELKIIRSTQLKKWFENKILPEKDRSLISQLQAGKASFGEKVSRRLENDYGMPPYYLDGGASVQNISLNSGTQNNFSGGFHGNQYNVINSQDGIIQEYKLPDGEAVLLKVMPLLDIADGIRYAVEQSVRLEMQKRSDKIATFISHSADTFGVKMPDDSMECENNKGIYQDDILIIEPKIEARDNDIVLVDVGGRPLVARLEIDVLGKCSLRQFKRGLFDMPDYARICGVVIELKRRLVASSIIEARLVQSQNKGV